MANKWVPMVLTTQPSSHFIPSLYIYIGRGSCTKGEICKKCKKDSGVDMWQSLNLVIEGIKVIW